MDSFWLTFPTYEVAKRFCDAIYERHPFTGIRTYCGPGERHAGTMTCTVINGVPQVRLEYEYINDPINFNKLCSLFGARRQ